MTRRREISIKLRDMRKATGCFESQEAEEITHFKIQSRRRNICVDDLTDKNWGKVFSIAYT